MPAEELSTASSTLSSQGESERCFVFSTEETRSLVPVLASKGNLLRVRRCRRCLLESRCSFMSRCYLDALYQFRCHFRCPSKFRCWFRGLFDAVTKFFYPRQDHNILHNLNRRATRSLTSVSCCYVRRNDTRPCSLTRSQTKAANRFIPLRIEKSQIEFSSLEESWIANRLFPPSRIVKSKITTSHPEKSRNRKS
jgi:hypothetical protein